MFKKGLLLTIIFLLIFSICGYASYYKYTMESGANFYVSSADKADALESENEKRQILDDLGNLLGHSKRDDSYPKDETIGGKLSIPPGALLVAANDADTRTKAIANYVCNGTNDQVEIQAAIDSLSTTGGEVHLTEGSFHLGAAIDLDQHSVSLVGSNVGAVPVATAYGTTIFQVNDTQNAIVIAAHQVQVRNLYIRGSPIGEAKAGEIGIHITSGQDCKIDNVNIIHFNTYGISFDNVNNMWLTNSRLSTNTTNLYMSSAHDITIANNQFETPTTYSAHLLNCYSITITGTTFEDGATQTLFLSNCDKSSIIGNVFNGASEADRVIYFTNSDRNTMAGNVIEANAGEGVRFETSTNNIFSDNIILGVPDGEEDIYLRNDNTGNIITNNRCLSSAATYSIHVDMDGNTGNSIYGNHCSSSISDTSGNNNLCFQGPQGHKIITIADGDATPDVSGGDIHITSSNTGATEITDLDLPTVGQIVTLIGGSNTNSSTITDGGNFSLEGNWTASLDKVLILFVQADNDYVEIARSTIGDDTIVKADFADEDWGDMSVSSNSVTLDANVVSDNEIDYTNVTLNDLTFDVGNVSKTEFGYLNDVTSAIQTQFGLRYLKTEVDSQGEVEIIWGVTLATDTELGNLTYSDVGAIQDAANTIDSDKYVDASIDHEHLAPDVISGLAEVTSEDADMMIISDNSDGGALKKVDMGEVRGAGGGYIDLTEFVTQNNWKVFYSDGSGDVKELSIGANGTYLQSNGATSAPTFETGSDITNWVIPQDYATGAGTEGDPWAGSCIEDAYAAASAGDTIYLRAGYYQLNGELALAKAINIIGEGMGKTFIVTANATGFSITGDYVSIQNLTMDGDAQTDDTEYLTPIECTGGSSDFVLVRDVEVKNAGYYGINPFEVNNSIFQNLYLHDNFRHGIHPGTNTTGRNKWNTYQNIYGHDNGVTLLSDRGCNVTGNYEATFNVYDNINAWDNADGNTLHAVIIGCQKNVVISNCFVDSNDGIGLRLAYLQDSSIVNCTISNNATYGVTIVGSKNLNFTNVIVRNNNSANVASTSGIRVENSSYLRFNNCQMTDDRSLVGTDIAFVDGGAGADTITQQPSARFITAGLVAGNVFTVAGSTSSDGDYTIVSLTAGTITLATDSLPGSEAAGDSVTITQVKLQDYAMKTVTSADNIEFINCDLRGNLLGRIYDTLANISGIDVHTLIEDHDYSGKWETITVGESVVFGELLYFNWTDKEWKKIDADAAATMPGLRIALESAVDGVKCLALIEGDIRDDSAFAFAGSMVYASCTPGDITSTAPNVSGDQVQRVGVAKHADYFYFDPSPDVGEI